MAIPIAQAQEQMRQAVESSKCSVNLAKLVMFLAIYIETQQLKNSLYQVFQLSRLENNYLKAQVVVAIDKLTTEGADFDEMCDASEQLLNQFPVAVVSEILEGLQAIMRDYPISPES